MSKKFKLCVSGAAETGHCGPNALELAKELGAEVVRQGGILVTGATTGFPLWAAMGAKEAGGMSIGLSPASSEREHTEIYGLPTEYMDMIIYTGFGYSGRNLLMTRSADAVLIGCGRVGTINEFTVAFEDGKPIGVLQGEWATDELLQEIMDKGYRHREGIIFDADPKSLVSKIVTILKKDQTAERRTYINPGIIL